MKIDGKALADVMLAQLAKTVKEKNLHPALAVILVGDNPESLAYIRQKKIATERIGGRFILEKLPAVTTQKELDARVAMYNNDPAVTGVIVQRPIPGITARVASEKDVDGFEENSPFAVPTAQAVLLLLKKFAPDFQNKRIVVVGRGETAGKPIAASLAKLHCTTSIVHSETPDPDTLLRQADSIISCVGKPVITAGSVKPGALLLSVGLWRDSTGSLHGDYEENDIKDIAGAYTPTPGGVGPVNIACLMQNLVMATQKMTH